MARLSCDSYSRYERKFIQLNILMLALIQLAFITGMDLLYRKSRNKFGALGLSCRLQLSCSC